MELPRQEIYVLLSDRGRGPDQLEKLGLPMLWKISTDYLVSGKKTPKAANEINLIRIF